LCNKSKKKGTAANKVLSPTTAPNTQLHQRPTSGGMRQYKRSATSKKDNRSSIERKEVNKKY
jgi:hypothetical protein